MGYTNCNHNDIYLYFGSSYPLVEIVLHLFKNEIIRESDLRLQVI
jgi:hypothetical protein